MFLFFFPNSASPAVLIVRFVERRLLLHVRDGTIELMGKILKQLEVLGNKGKQRVEVLFDTGASQSCIRRDVATRVATVFRKRSAKTFVLADGRTQIKTDEVAVLDLRINGKAIDDYFYVLKDGRREVIVGAGTMQRWDLKLHPRRHLIEIGTDPEDLELL